MDKAKGYVNEYIKHTNQKWLIQDIFRTISRNSDELLRLQVCSGQKLHNNK